MKYILLLLALGSSAYAATTGSITLSGVIPAATAIVLTPITTSLNLNNTTTNLNVVNVREINNTVNGYKVFLTSANSGQLKNGTLGQVGYTARYNSVVVTLSSTAVQITNAPASNTIVNVLKPFDISYTGVANDAVMQGTYSDTLTFTIVAN